VERALHAGPQKIRQQQQCRQRGENPQHHAPVAPLRGGQRRARVDRGFEHQRQCRQQCAVGLGERRQERAADQPEQCPGDAAPAVPGQHQAPPARVGEQAQQHEKRRQHGLALHHVQRRRYEQRRQQPQCRAQHRRACRARALRLEHAAETPQQRRQQRAVDQLQQQVGELEWPRRGRPVARVDQETQQGERPSGGVAAAGGEVAPEDRPGMHRAEFAERGQGAEIIEQERSLEAGPVGPQRDQQRREQAQRRPPAFGQQRLFWRRAGHGRSSVQAVHDGMRAQVAALRFRQHAVSVPRLRGDDGPTCAGMTGQLARG